MRIIAHFDKFFILSLKNEFLTPQFFNEWLDADVYAQSRYGKGYYKVCKSQIICYEGDDKPKIKDMIVLDMGDAEG